MQITFEDSGTPLKKSKNRKGETCGEQLRRMCKDIAQDITDAKQQDYIDQPRKEITASEWMEGTSTTYVTSWTGRSVTTAPR
jgi:hypothetical protein